MSVLDIEADARRPEPKFHQSTRPSMSTGLDIVVLGRSWIRSSAENLIRSRKRLVRFLGDLPAGNKIAIR